MQSTLPVELIMLGYFEEGIGQDDCLGWFPTMIDPLDLSLQSS
jgi:hypothetical protein